MPAKKCVLYDRNCCGCNECEKCDLDPEKICDSCGKCLLEEKGYREIKIDAVVMEDDNKE